MGQDVGCSFSRSTFRAWAALVVGVAGLGLIGGCSSVERPHARMSRAELEERVEDEFPLGTPREAVLTRLRREQATFDAPLPMLEPEGWSTLRLYFDQPWWAGLEWATTYRKTEAWADLLFDQGESLREVRGEVQERTW